MITHVNKQLNRQRDLPPRFLFKFKFLADVNLFEITVCVQVTDNVIMIKNFFIFILKNVPEKSYLFGTLIPLTELVI